MGYGKETKRTIYLKMCKCRATPFEKLEMRLTTRGWNRLAPSETAILDVFIHDKLGVYPTTTDERYDLYRKAKQVK